MSMSDPLNHLESIWQSTEPLDVPYSPNQYLDRNLKKIAEAMYPLIRTKFLKSFFLNSIYFSWAISSWVYFKCESSQKCCGNAWDRHCCYESEHWMDPDFMKLLFTSLIVTTFLAIMAIVFHFNRDHSTTTLTNGGCTEVRRAPLIHF